MLLFVGHKICMLSDHNMCLFAHLYWTFVCLYNTVCVCLRIIACFWLRNCRACIFGHMSFTISTPVQGTFIFVPLSLLLFAPSACTACRIMALKRYWQRGPKCQTFEMSCFMQLCGLCCAYESSYFTVRLDRKQRYTFLKQRYTFLKQRYEV